MITQPTRPPDPAAEVAHLRASLAAAVDARQAQMARLRELAESWCESAADLDAEARDELDADRRITTAGFANQSRRCARELLAVLDGAS